MALNETRRPSYGLPTSSSAQRTRVSRASPLPPSGDRSNAVMVMVIVRPGGENQRAQELGNCQSKFNDIGNDPAPWNDSDEADPAIPLPPVCLRERVRAGIASPSARNGGGRVRASRGFLFGRDELAVEQTFRDLHRVERCALAQIV